jgi:ribose 5-phosphate isomerase B
MKIPIASDHAGFQAKEKIKHILMELHHQPIDLGTTTEESVDYPDFAVKVAEAVNSDKYKSGILVCGSGQGVCMTANKYSNIRAALVYDEDSAIMSRRHNNANILCLAGRKLNEDELQTLVKKWLETNFEGGRHERRTKKIKSLTEGK